MNGKNAASSKRYRIPAPVPSGGIEWILVCVLLIGSWIASTARGQENILDCGDEPTDMSIGYGDIIECSFASGIESDLFRWSGTAGDVVLIRSRARSGDPLEPCLIVFDANQDRIAQSLCDADNQYTQSVEVELTTSGPHTLLVRERGQNEAGRYRLTVERLFPFSPTAEPVSDYGVARTRSIELQVDFDFYLIESAADETFSFSARAVSGFPIEPCLQLYAPNRDLVATSACSQNNQYLQRIDDFKTSIAGRYLLRVHERGANESGRYEFSVQCLFGTCSAIPANSLFRDDFEIATLDTTGGKKIWWRRRESNPRP